MSNSPQLIKKANQLRGEALQLEAQPSAEARQQAIAKYEELVNYLHRPDGTV